MTSIVTSILSATVGLLWNKTRDSTAAKLQDGDVTDTKIREIVMRELDDVKTKLDGLSRKDLLSSYDFLQEGVDLLNVSLDKSKLEVKDLVSGTQDDLGETSTVPSGVQSRILNEVVEFSQAMGKLKGNSNKEFELARKRFKDARKTATHAFRIESLYFKDRMMAAKLRIVSEILEHLESPETAITGCMSFLKKLHRLSAVKQMFTVYLRSSIVWGKPRSKVKAMKAMMNKDERVENVKSVMLINFVLFQHVSKFGSKYCSAYAWPTIELDDDFGRFYPILSWHEVSARTSMGEELSQLHPGKLILDDEIHPEYFAVNGHGDIVVGGDPDIIKVFSKTGESKVVKLPEPTTNGKVVEKYFAGLAVDEGNNIYVVRWLRIRTESGEEKSYVLNVLDENYNVKQDSCTLDVCEETDDLRRVKIAVNKNNYIIMIKDDDPHVYICDQNGNLRHKFEHYPGWSGRGSYPDVYVREHNGKLRHKLEHRSGWSGRENFEFRPVFVRDNTRTTTGQSRHKFEHYSAGCQGNLSISEKNRTMISSGDLHAVCIYSEKGKLKSTLELPEDHVVLGVAFHYITCKIIVLTYVERKDSFFLLCCTEAGDMEAPVLFYKRLSGESDLYPNITSHPCGPVAVVMSRSVTFI